MATQVSLTKNERKKYKKMVGIIALVFLFFFASRLFLKPNVTDNSTKIGEEITLDSRTMQLVNRSYYPNDETFTFSFLSPVNSGNVLDELKGLAKQDRSDKTKYDLSVSKITDDYYVVTIRNLPEKWSKLDVTIYAKGANLDSYSADQKFHFVKDKVDEKSNYSGEQSKAVYELEAIQFELKDVEKKLKTTKKQIVKQETDISKIEKINEDLSKTESEKTDKEQEELRQTINQNESKISTIENEITTLKETKTELKNKIEILKERQGKLEK